MNRKQWVITMEHSISKISQLTPSPQQQLPINNEEYLTYLMSINELKIAQMNRIQAVLQLNVII